MRNLVLALSLLFTAPAFAQEASDIPPSPIAKTQLLVHAPQVKAGEPITAGVLFTLPEGWHIYWQNPGDSGIPTSLAWTLPEDMTASAIQWPVPERIETAGLVNYGYSEKVILPVTLTADTDGVEGPIVVKADWLVCKETCIPESATLEAALPISNPQAQVLLNNIQESLPHERELDAQFSANDERVTITLPAAALGVESTPASVQWLPVEDGIVQNTGAQEFRVENDTITLTAPRGTADLPEEWRGLLLVQDGPEDTARAFNIRAARRDAALPASTTAQAGEATTTLPLMLAVLFAFLGGVILNAMPCVLPILSLKALALAKKSGAEQRVARAQGLAYTAGVVLSFLVVAGLMLALKAGGAAIGWGFQLQEPGFVAALYFLMLLVALNLLGLFELPVLFGQTQTDNHSLRGAFLTGALAVALATPCTAPFMAPALGATLALSTPATLLVFASLGLGMAAPFLLISVWPAARRLLPKPGVWMLRFKQFLAFPMFATAAWLLWVLTNSNGSIALVQALTATVLVAWLLWWAYGTPSARRRQLTRFAAACVVMWGVIAQTSSVPASGMADGITTVPYDAQVLEKLRAEGTPVFIDATADWCITCKINERIALRGSTTQTLFKERGITLMVADWTRQDAAITEYLKGFGRNGVPLYVYYAPNAEPVVLPQLLTPSAVQQAITSSESSTQPTE